MTKEEQNIKVQSYLEPDKCRHEWGEIYYKGLTAYSKCEKCSEEGHVGYLPDNPDYLTMNGIGLIKEWLEKEGKWYDEFIDFVYNSKGSTLVECKEMFADILTNPELFIPKFIEYMESK